MLDYLRGLCYLDHLLEIISEFNEIYTKIQSRYNEYERKRLSRKKKRERKVGAGRIPFKLIVKERFLMLLVYYRLYITYTLSGS